MVFERNAPARDRPRRAGNHGKRVLVADDDEYARHLLASALRFAGFVVDLGDGTTKTDAVGFCQGT
jgi:CheY-like chemotaxis protein